MDDRYINFLNVTMAKIQSKEHELDFLKQQLEVLTNRIKSVSNEVDALKNDFIRVLDENNTKSIQLPLFGKVVSYTTEKVVVTNKDLSTLPAEFYRVTYEPNKVAIKTALSNGEVLPGCELKKTSFIRLYKQQPVKQA